MGVGLGGGALGANVTRNEGKGCVYLFFPGHMDRKMGRFMQQACGWIVGRSTCSRGLYQKEMSVVCAVGGVRGSHG